jgi:hypothetical protein
MAGKKMKTTEPTSRQRGRSTSTKPQLSKIIKVRTGKIGRGSQLDA